MDDALTARPRIEVRSRQGWRSLDRRRAWPIDESELFRVRGLRPGTTLSIGDETRVASAQGEADIGLLACEGLRGHIGLIEVRVDGEVVGEVDVVPDKMSADAYRTLRADLVRVWSGLVFDTNGPSRLEAGLPPPQELWTRIEGSVRSIAAAPRELLTATRVSRKHDRVRRARELSPSVVRAGARGAAGVTTTVVRSTDTAENRMVADTLRRLHVYAERHAEGAEVARCIGSYLGHPVFATSRSARPKSDVLWGVRSDHRYQKVQLVRTLLDRPELEPTEGPGDLRLGVRSLVRLYEYWVFLQVLLLASQRYGPPTGAGFEALATRLDDGRTRLELLPGTTIEFPGDVFIAFEPAITVSGGGWMGVELVSHPDPAEFHSLATPDVVLLRAGREPSMTVIDAKYVARSWVERSAVRTHAKYGRMRFEGRPVVDNVVVVHPHLGIDSMWAGYGSFPMCPGSPMGQLSLPEPICASTPEGGTVASVPGGAARGFDRPAVDPGPPGVLVVADQGWMHRVLDGQRIDLDDLLSTALQGREARGAITALPAIPALDRFGAALEARGWQVIVTPDVARSQILEALDKAVKRSPGPVVLVSGDQPLIDQITRVILGRGDDLEILDDLSGVARL